MTTELRALRDSDLDAVFEMMADPAAVRMAAFTASDPTDRVAFDVHMARVLGDPAVDYRAITDGTGQLVGIVSSFPGDDGLTEITYWVERHHWGLGHASRAVALMLAQTGRPVLARVAADNGGSRRVLDKAGFQPIGTNRDFGHGRRTEVD